MSPRHDYDPKTDCCRTCRFAWVPSDPKELMGACRINPPTIYRHGDEGQPIGGFPPVHLDNFTCGEHRP